MKKTLLYDGNMYVIDADNNTVYRPDREYQRIDTIYTVDEDADIYIQQPKENKSVPVHVEKGDILITFYSSEYPNKTIIVKSPEWLENFKAAHEAEQKRKEEWAAKQEATQNGAENQFSNDASRVA